MRTYRIAPLYIAVVGGALLHLALSVALNAQTTRFEFSYGSPTCRETGVRGVEPIDLPGGCCDGGYIAVGTSSEAHIGSNCASQTNVYVVRTNSDGTQRFSFVYDIAGRGGFDEGTSIKEIESGFIITGNTIANEFGATSDIFLLEIDCDGNVVRTTIYETPNINDFANDIIVAEIGNGVTTNPGDFIIAGSTQRMAPTMSDGLILRTTATGTLIWNKAYNVPGSDPDQHDEFLTALIETKVTGAGDIVAVGHTTSFSFIGPTFFGTQGLVIRVNGNTGNTGPTIQRVSHYGGALNDRFDAVTELSTAAEAGNLVFAGSTSQPGAEDIYLVKTEANPCVMLAQNRIDHMIPTGGLGEAAFGIVEVTMPGITFCPVGDLAIVGRTMVPCADPDPPFTPDTHDDGLLIHVTPSTLQVVAGLQFGSQMGCLRSEVFHSIKDVGDGDRGFIICGTTQENLNPIAPPPPLPDPSDLYLVKTNQNGTTCCSEPWTFVQVDPDWDNACVLATVVSPLLTRTVTTLKGAKNAPEQVCSEVDCFGIDDPPGGGGGSGIRELPQDQPGFSESGSLNLPLSGKGEASAGDGTGKSATIRAKVRMKEE